VGGAKRSQRQRRSRNPVGTSLTEAAEALHVSIHTARSQLKSIQHKTGWHTESELARMVQQFSVIAPRSPHG
jgi:hypothetical protein